MEDDNNDSSKWLPRFIFHHTFLLSFWLFLQFLLLGLDDIAFHSPIDPEMICLAVNPLCTGFVAIFMEIKAVWLGDLISTAMSSQQYRTPAAFCVCAWIYVSVVIIAGGNLLLILSVPALSASAISFFKVVAKYQDFLVMARWVLAQSLTVSVALVCQGYFIEAAIAILPILLAICAMLNSVENLYYDGPDEPADISFMDRKEKKSKSSGQNHNIANATQMMAKIVDTVDISANMAQKDSCLVDSVGEMCLVDMDYAENIKDSASATTRVDAETKCFQMC